MTDANFEYRLDQVETIAAILVTHIESIDSRLERIASNQEQSDRRIDGLAARIDGLAGRVESLTSNVDTLAALMGQQFAQAEQDRAEFRATVTGILDTLNQRFSSNGHS